jgi:hypothetical protein
MQTANQITFLTFAFSVAWYNFSYTELFPKKIEIKEMRCTTTSDISNIVTVA